VLFLRIKQAETALADGRLEETAELLADPDVREHRHGQRLTSELIKAYVKRGREHLEAGRLPAAMSDCTRAAQLGGADPEIESLRTAIGQAMADHDRDGRRRNGMVAAARQQMAQGDVSAAEALVAGLEHSERAEGLLHEADLRRRQAQTAIRRARQCIECDDWTGALNHLAAAMTAHGSNPELAELTGQVVSRIAERTREALVQGRLDLAESLAQRLCGLPTQAVEAAELRRALDECRAAWRCIAAGRFRDGWQSLNRVRTIVPEAKWLVEAIGAAQRAAEAAEHLGAGPLGLLGAQVEPSPSVVPVKHVAAQRAAEVTAPRTKMGGRFAIHADGVGSFLVLSGDRVSIGCGKSSRPDVVVQAETDCATVTFERIDEDYFASSDKPIMVGGRETWRALLSDGVRIELSRRCRLKFLLPNAASTTAVVELCGTRLARGEARRIILMDREIVMGPSAGAHIRTEQLSQPVVMYRREGRVMVRTGEAVTVEGRPYDGEDGIAPGARVAVGGVSMVIVDEA